MTPEEFSELMDENRDEKYRLFSTRILQTPLEVTGVRVPVLRRTAKKICKGDWRSFISQPTIGFEHCFTKALVIATADTTSFDRLALSEEFLPEIRDWSVCDTFCGAWRVDEDIKDDLWRWCESLMDSGGEFSMRVGAVMLMCKFIDDEHIEKLLKLYTKKRASSGYYWDMGCAWALSFCYIAYPDLTEDAMFDGNLSPEILRMTVYKIRDSYRVSEEKKTALKTRYQEFRARSS